MRTQLALEIMGKLDDFAKVFDIERYKKNSLGFKIHSLQNYGEEPLDTENVDLAKENNFPMPERRDCFVLNQSVMVMDKK